MILPTKHLEPERSLLGVGADCLRLLDRPKTISRLWDDYKTLRTGSWLGSSRVTFDWFVLALDFLYCIGAVRSIDGVLQRTTR